MPCSLISVVTPVVTVPPPIGIAVFQHDRCNITAVSRQIESARAGLRRQVAAHADIASPTVCKSDVDVAKLNGAAIDAKPYLPKPLAPGDSNDITISVPVDAFHAKQLPLVVPVIIVASISRFSGNSEYSRH